MEIFLRCAFSLIYPVHGVIEQFDLRWFLNAPNWLQTEMGVSVLTSLLNFEFVDWAQFSRLFRVPQEFARTGRQTNYFRPFHKLGASKTNPIHAKFLQPAKHPFWNKISLVRSININSKLLSTQSQHSFSPLFIMLLINISVKSVLLFLLFLKRGKMSRSAKWKE